MPNKLTAFVLLLTIISIDTVYGIDGKTKNNKTNHKSNSNLNVKINSNIVKRSLNENEASPPWSNQGLKIVPENSRYDYDLKDKISTNLNAFRKLEIEPFWGTRGRRDSSSAEYYKDEYSGNLNPKDGNKLCKDCPTPSNLNYRNVKISRDEYSPFWGNRGRRGSGENDLPAVFWGSRGIREDNEPFWGNRGRRKDDPPFWGNRGRREDEPFWGNRGKRESVSPWNHISMYEEEPFWSSRGRREDIEPFWGNRGRREDIEPFWGNRGRREESEPFWGNRGRRKEDLKESILTAIDNAQNDIENLSRLQRSGNSFWANRGRQSSIQFLPKAPVRTNMLSAPNSETVHDSRIYAEQPRYILVERSSRASAEEDPYYISRGKKFYLNYNLIKAARDRRGAIEEIVKSVRNDPFYIARGKKRREDFKLGNNTQHEAMLKVKDLVCSAVDLITINQNSKVKRDINDNERDRRTILKKLAAQLQMDPYFVSRGKKDDENTDKDYLNDFINDMAEKCN